MKLVLILWFLFWYSWKIVCNTMLYIIIQYNWEPVLIQWLLIGFENISNQTENNGLDIIQGAEEKLIFQNLVLISKPSEGFVYYHLYMYKWYLIQFGKKFQTSIFHKSRENHVSSNTFQAYGHFELKISFSNKKHIKNN